MNKFFLLIPLLCAQSAIADGEYATGIKPPHAAIAPLLVQEVAAGNFVHMGRHVGFEDPAHDDIANIGFIAGENCVAVIDTGGSIKIGQSLRAAVKAHSKLPICYVINTHIHVDHVLGNAAFKADTPVFVGHHLLREAFVGNRNFFLENFAADLQTHAGDTASVDDIVAPDQGVEDTLELDLGGKRLLLTAYPKAHTNADLTVLDKSTGTLWLGDLLFIERIPSIDSTVKGWLSVNDTLAGQVDIKLAIPGHGAPTADLAAALSRQRAYLQMLVEQARAMIAQGAPLELAMQQIGMPQAMQWQLWEQGHRRNVIRVFKELEWE